MFGKNKVISLALGRGPESEYKENLHKITSHLFGNIGLLFTNRPKEEILKYAQIFFLKLDKNQCFNYFFNYLKYKDILKIIRVQIMLDQAT